MAVQGESARVRCSPRPTYVTASEVWNYSMELLPNYKKPTVTLVMTHSDQATHRAISTLGDYTHHSGTFVATEGELLAGDHESSVWQICGTGMNNNPPVEIDPNITLAEIITGIDRLLETSYVYRIATGNISPNPDALYSSPRRATMPEPSEQLARLMGGVTRRR